jgi:hypothetical protein
MSAVGTKILGKIGNLTDWLLPSADQRLRGGDDLVIALRGQMVHEIQPQEYSNI